MSKKIQTLDKFLGKEGNKVKKNTQKLPRLEIETEYKETLIGKIPKDWEIVKFRNILQ